MHEAAHALVAAAYHHVVVKPSQADQQEHRHRSVSADEGSIEAEIAKENKNSGSSSGEVWGNVLKYETPAQSLLLPLVFLLLGVVALPGPAPALRPRTRLRANADDDAAVESNDDGDDIDGGVKLASDNSCRGRCWRVVAALAGPAGSLLAACVFAAPLWAQGGASAAPERGAGAWAGLALAVRLQLMATVLALVPVPGSDGAAAVSAALPAALTRGPRLLPETVFSRRARTLVVGVGSVALFVLVWCLPGGSSWATDAAVGFGVPRGDVEHGLTRFRLVKM